MTDTIYEFEAETIDGESRSLADYKGQVLLIVNTASKCGFTPQYAGLEALHQKFKDQGFAVLGFPCNQFGNQEPGDADEISQFCEINYGVSFPMFAKIDVNGDNAHPLFRYLTSAQPGILGSQGIKWNFTKFLVDRSGRAVERFSPQTKPEALERIIKSQLKSQQAEPAA